MHPHELLKALDETRTALYEERAEKSALEQKVVELTGVIAHQDRKLEDWMVKHADYDRMKEELENVKNELVSTLQPVTAGTV